MYKRQISVSGTVTLEIALVGTPMVIIYKLAPLTYQVARRVVKIKHIGLCNIVAGRSIVKELIQDQANPAEIADEITAILTNNIYRATMHTDLASINEKLGGGGAALRTASLSLDLINKKQYCGSNSDFKSKMPSRRRGMRRRRHTNSMLRSRSRANDDGALIWNWYIASVGES